AGVAGGDRIGKGQGRGAAPRRVVDDLVGGAGLEREPGSPGDVDRLGEVDLERDDVAGLVRAVRGRGGDAGDGRRGRVDDEILVGAERVGGAGRGERQRRGVERRVLDRAAVERERGRVVVVEVGAGVAGGDRIGKGQGRGAAARRVVDYLVGGAGLEHLLSCPTRRSSDLEVDLERDRVAGLV